MSLRKTFVKSGAYSTGSRFYWRYSNQSFRNMRGARNPGVYLASISEAMAGVLRHLLAEQIEDIEAQIQAPARGVRQAGDRPARRHGLFERPGNCFTFSCSTRPADGASSDLAGPPGQIARLARARQTQAERSGAPLLPLD